MRPNLDGTTPGLRHNLPSWRTALKAVIGIALIIGMLLWKNNAEQLLKTFSDFDPEYILILTAISVALNLLSSLKWRLFVVVRGLRLSPSGALKLYLIGKFFGNFLPSMFGGDVTRSYLLGRQIKSQALSAATVVLDRATGVVGLTILAAVVICVNPDAFKNPIAIAAVGAAIIGCVGSCAVFFSSQVARRVIPALSRLGWIGRKITRMINEIINYRNDRRLLWLALAYSLGFHFVAAVNVYVACLSIGFEPKLIDILVVTPAIMLLSMIPVSPNNIGWWEWCFSVFLLDAGATAAEGFAVALILRGVGMVTSLLGGLLFLLHRD